MSILKNRAGSIPGYFDTRIVARRGPRNWYVCVEYVLNSGDRLTHPKAENQLASWTRALATRLISVVPSSVFLLVS